jgi:hypothetical protein
VTAGQRGQPEGVHAPDGVTRPGYPRPMPLPDAAPSPVGAVRRTAAGT